jgi:hypothetical protein
VLLLVIEWERLRLRARAGVKITPVAQLVE